MSTDTQQESITCDYSGRAITENTFGVGVEFIDKRRFDAPEDRACHFGSMGCLDAWERDRART
ncbi:MAG: hypothetical protein JO015_14560 [Verrucomicrobia bacterium]|nr:hypothetical protein [Verrucomicrobiota bacterium]